MSFSVRLSAEEKILAENYSKHHAAEIEDEYDIAVAEEAHAEYVNDGRKSRPISELWKELDL